MKKDEQADSNSDQGNRALFIVVLIFFAFAFALYGVNELNLESSYALNDFTEAEMARIESMKARIQQAPESSIILRSKDTRCEERIQVISWVNENRFSALSLGVSGLYPVTYSLGNDHLVSVIEVIYPSDDQYNEYLRKLVSLPTVCIEERS